jgi:hypothetical protein
MPAIESEGERLGRNLADMAAIGPCRAVFENATIANWHLEL